MLRIWGKIYKNNKLINDTVIENNSKTMDFTTKIDMVMEELCLYFDLQKPLWLNENLKDLNRFSRTVFTQSHFIEEINFDYLEIEIIENTDPE